MNMSKAREDLKLGKTSHKSQTRKSSNKCHSESRKASETSTQTSSHGMTSKASDMMYHVTDDEGSEKHGDHQTNT